MAKNSTNSNHPPNSDDIEVSCTAVEIRWDDELWQLRLLDVLEALQKGVPQGIGI